MLLKDPSRVPTTVLTYKIYTMFQEEWNKLKLLFCRQKTTSTCASLHVLVVLLLSSTGAAEKPYTVEDAVSYNELDYLSVSVLCSIM